MRLLILLLVLALCPLGRVQAQELSPVYRDILAGDAPALRRVRAQYCGYDRVSWLMCDLLLVHPETDDLPPVWFIGDRLAKVIASYPNKFDRGMAAVLVSEWETLLPLPEQPAAQPVAASEGMAAKPMPNLGDALVIRLSFHLQHCADGVAGSCIGARRLAAVMPRTVNLLRITASSRDMDTVMWFRRQGW